AVHHDRGAVPHTRFVLGDELHRLLAARRQEAEEHGRQPVQREPLGAVDHLGGKILVAETYDPLRELPAERSHAFLPGMVDAARTGPPDSQAGPARANDEEDYRRGEKDAGIRSLFS